VLTRVLLLTVVVTAAVAGPTVGAAPRVPNDQAAIEHALSRLTFGPRPDDVERVRKMGLDKWIDRQLGNGQEDSALEARLPRADPMPPDITTPQQARRFGRQQVAALASAKVLRAVYSERQLEEILVDFWFNHFNVFAGNGRTALYLADYEQSVIRPHVFGHFRELLEATAKSPAMLFYLDNFQSVAPGTTTPLRRNGQATPRGLNENYGRELLELHTLGVDGGYTQDDVINVARAFTGWTIDPRQAAFRFADARHDRGDKQILGESIRAGGGINDGERVLDILAAHPATARHIATKLARRFVSDDPPPELVARAAKRFRDTHGDLRAVVRTIVTSPEFFAASARRAKVKTPLEFVASAIRSAGVEVTAAAPILRELQQMGMAPYMCQPPTGYADTADAWASSGALVERINFATRMATGNLRGVSAPRGDGGALALRLSAPEFQRR
jgi:uncharacterized protein (DUF1800 family)